MEFSDESSTLLYVHPAVWGDTLHNGV